MDSNAVGDRPVAFGRQGIAVVVRSVSGDVDDPAHSLEAVVVEPRQDKRYDAADRGPEPGRNRRFGYRPGQGPCAAFVLDDGPVRDHPAMSEIRPLHIADGDAAAKAGPTDSWDKRQYVKEVVRTVTKRGP